MSKTYAKKLLSDSAYMRIYRNIYLNLVFNKGAAYGFLKKNQFLLNL